MIEFVRFYGYKHWTQEDPPRCFNVGKGVLSRSKSKRSRNHKWHAIVKRFGLRVEVCIGPVTNDEACAWEVENIASMGTFSTCNSHDDSNDIGCNFTKGGEGTSGYQLSVQTKEKLSMIGRLHQAMTQNRVDVKKKRSCSLREHYQKNGTNSLKEAAHRRFSRPDERRKFSEAMSRACKRIEVRLQRSESAKKRWDDPVYRRRMNDQRKKPQKCGRCGDLGHNRRRCQA